MIDLKFLNEAVMATDGNEFRVLYLIANTLGMKGGRSVIYREVIADKLGIDVKTVTRLTDKLVKKNLLKKDVVSDGKKKKNYYSLNKDRFVQEKTQNEDEFVPQNTLIWDGNVPFNKYIKEKKLNKDSKRHSNTTISTISNDRTMVGSTNNSIGTYKRVEDEPFWKIINKDCEVEEEVIPEEVAGVW